MANSYMQNILGVYSTDREGTSPSLLASNLKLKTRQLPIRTGSLHVRMYMYIFTNPRHYYSYHTAAHLQNQYYMIDIILY